MANLRNQLAEIYVKVVADTKAAQTSMDSAVDKMKKGAKGLQDIIRYQRQGSGKTIQTV